MTMSEQDPKQPQPLNNGNPDQPNPEGFPLSGEQLPAEQSRQPVPSGQPSFAAQPEHPFPPNQPPFVGQQGQPIPPNQPPSAGQPPFMGQPGQPVPGNQPPFVAQPGQPGQPVPPGAPQPNPPYWTPGMGNPNQPMPGRPFNPGQQPMPGQPFNPGQPPNAGQPFIPGQAAPGQRPNPGQAFMPGQPQGSGPVPFQPGGPAGQVPVKANRKTLVIVGAVIAGLIVLALVGALAFKVINKKPEDVARDYIQAVASGNVDKALGFLDLDDEQVLPVDAMKGALKDGDIKITDITGSTMGKGHTAVVDFTYKGYEDFAIIELTNTGGTFGSKWEIVDGGLGTLSVSGDDDDETVSVNGTDVLPGDYLALPGTYAVNGVDNLFYDSDSNAEDLSWGSFAYISTYLEVSDQGVSAVQKKADSIIDDCLAKGSFEPSGCPFFYSYFGDETKAIDIKWKRTDTSYVSVYSSSADTVTFDYTADTELSYKTDSSSTDPEEVFPYISLQGTAKLVGDNEVEVTFDE